MYSEDVRTRIKLFTLVCIVKASKLPAEESGPNLYRCLRLCERTYKEMDAFIPTKTQNVVPVKVLELPSPIGAMDSLICGRLTTVMK